MKLYYKPGSCSLAPHIVAREAGIDFTLDKVNTKEMRTEGGADYLKINPKGYVPAIELDDGHVLSEAAVCVLYVADKASADKKLIAHEGFERYRAQEWLNFISTEIHKNVGALFKPAPEDVQKGKLDLVEKRLGFLETHLGKSAFLMGNDYTAPDAYLYTILRWTKFAKVDLTKFPSVLAYFKKVGARPAVQAALQAEGQQ
jgi:glutathione S-transferase